MNGADKRKNIIFERRGQYVHATIPPSQIDRSMAKEYFSEILLKCSVRHDKRLMIECDIADPQDSLELVPVLNEIVRISGGMRIAFLNTVGPTEDIGSFAFDNGADDGADYRYFTEKEQAVAWIVAGRLNKKRATRLKSDL